MTTNIEDKQNRTGWEIQRDWKVLPSVDKNDQTISIAEETESVWVKREEDGEEMSLTEIQLRTDLGEVYKILKSNKPARNSDAVLIFNFLLQNGVKIIYSANTMTQLGRLTSIRRSRQILQNDLLIHRSDKQIEKARKLREEAFRKDIKKIDSLDQIKSK